MNKLFFNGLRFCTKKILKQISIPTKTLDQSPRTVKQKQKQESEEASDVVKFLSPDLPKPKIQTIQKSDEIYVDDYTQSQTKTKVMQEGDQYITQLNDINGLNSVKWNKNSSQQFDLSENPLALQVINEAQIDLNDPRIVISNLKQDSVIMGVNDSDLKEINLGRIQINQENSININDVDVHNIPDDIDIQLNRNYRELKIIGVQSEEGNDQGQIEHHIIEDISLQQFKEKHLYNFEYSWLVLDKMELLKKLIRRIPLYIFLYAFFDTIIQYYIVHEEVSRMEDQEWKPLNLFFEKQEIFLIKNDPIYAKINI